MNYTILSVILACSLIGGCSQTKPQLGHGHGLHEGCFNGTGGSNAGQKKCEDSAATHACAKGIWVSGQCVFILNTNATGITCNGCYEGQAVSNSNGGSNYMVSVCMKHESDNGPYLTWGPAQSYPINSCGTTNMGGTSSR